MRKTAFFALALTLISASAYAADNRCADLPAHEDLRAALSSAREEDNGGLNLDMWATVVDRSGVVCAVAYSGDRTDSQWPGSRVISAQKANTANAFSLSSLALSTANLYSAVQPGGPLFGLQESNPVNTLVAYEGAANNFGTPKDPMVGKRVGGVNVFGGGLALYDANGNVIGGLGVSGDTSCADHNIAWRLRHSLKLDQVPAGVAPTKNDQIIYDVTTGKSAGGYGHLVCGGKEEMIAKALPATAKAGNEKPAAPAEAAPEEKKPE